MTAGDLRKVRGVEAFQQSAKGAVTLAATGGKTVIRHGLGMITMACWSRLYEVGHVVNSGNYEHLCMETSSFLYVSEA